jgi:hypothetical protein
VPDKYETIEVELERDPVLGLGITVAGFVHKKGKSINSARLNPKIFGRF